MKVLVVGRDKGNRLRKAVVAQISALSSSGICVDAFGFKGGCFFSLEFFLSYFRLFEKIKKFEPDLIHANYGLTGLLCNLQRKTPVITTFHGSDVNSRFISKFSKVAHKLSSKSIFVEKSMRDKLGNRPSDAIIPCSVDMKKFFPLPRETARKQLNIRPHQIVILFSSSFDRKVKNYDLARQACNILKEDLECDISLIELKGYSQVEVNLLMNSANCSLITSYSEGSSQFLKEAMACSCPIISTDVGDARWVFGDTVGCYIVSYDPKDVAAKLKMGIDFSLSHNKTGGKDRIIELGLDSNTIQKMLINAYYSVLAKN